VTQSTPIVAISADFLTAYSRLPRTQQKKVREFSDRFRSDPTSPGINYEPMQHAVDANVRTVRIGLDYRAIVVHPEQGNVYLLAWVDHHDEAMRWAEKKRFGVNPTTGALQVYEVSTAEAPQARPAPAAAPPTGLFSEYSDDELLSIGVPHEQIGLVRSLAHEYDLDRAAGQFPEEAEERLYMLAAGFTLDDVLADPGAKPRHGASEDDFAAALKHPDSQRRFAVIADDRELADMLDAPLERWRVFLHPSQAALVARDFNGPASVLGGAGTGKTVVAMHRARHLARTVAREANGRVLFLTFSRNLASAIERNLDNLCARDEVRDRIEVTNLHRWVARYWRASGLPLNVASSAEIETCWAHAFASHEVEGFSEQFVRSEWEHVVQAQGIASERDYLRAPRTGRRTRLSRQQRALLWRVMAEYRRSLDDIGKDEWSDVTRETCAYVAARPGSLPYRCVVVDETQDMGPDELRLIRALVPEAPNDLFLVGDAHQRIYARPVPLRQCGVHVVGRSRRLRLNYRTTAEIQRWAMAVMAGCDVDDLDGGADDARGYRSLLHGPAPEVHRVQTLEDEVARILSVTRALLDRAHPEDICIVCRRLSPLRDVIAPALAGAGIDYVDLGDQRDSDEGKGVRLASMHRVKGLEFRHLVLARAVEGVLPMRSDLDEAADDAERAAAEQRERCLLYVAATRARDSLTIIAGGEPSRLLPGSG